MVHIIADSMSDITQVQGHEMSITIVPLSVEFSGEIFIDGVTIDPKEFYQKMRVAQRLPKTSQVAPDAFRRAFKKALENEGDEVLCITGSSKLSGTYQAAVIARDAQEEANQSRVYLVDSLNATLGGALLVRAAVKWRDEGLDAKAIAEKLNALKKRVRLSATVGDLKYLVMGGRLPAVGAKVSGLLNLRPTLRLVQGEVKTAGVCRGHSKMLAWFGEELTKNPPDPKYPIMLGHADAQGSMEELATFLKERFALETAPMTMAIGSVIGAHTGPGTFGMAWIIRMD